MTELNDKFSEKHSGWQQLAYLMHSYCCSDMSRSSQHRQSFYGAHHSLSVALVYTQIKAIYIYIYIYSNTLAIQIPPNVLSSDVQETLSTPC